MKVIFLDIDGVLVTSKSLAAAAAQAPGRPGWHRDAGDPACVAELNRILREVPTVGIVLSSVWRHMPDWHEVIVGRWGVGNVFLGTTPWGRVDETLPAGTQWRPKDAHDTAPRGVGIRTWLAGRSDVEAFVILDDDNDMDGLEEQYLVQANFESGLTKELADRAIWVLRGGSR